MGKEARDDEEVRCPAKIGRNIPEEDGEGNQCRGGEQGGESEGFIADAGRLGVGPNRPVLYRLAIRLRKKMGRVVECFVGEDRACRKLRPPL